MSVATIVHALVRIRSASPNSPIALFACPDSDFVDAVFARTVQSARDIEAGARIGENKSGVGESRPLIGVFSAADDERVVRDAIFARVNLSVTTSS